MNSEADSKGVNEVTELNNLFERAKESDNHNRVRGLRNTLATANIDGSMFNSAEIDSLIKGGSNVDGYNLFAKYLRGVAGSYLSNWFDPSFNSATKDGMSPDTLTKLEEIWKSNKDVNGYKRSVSKCVWDGLTYRGVEEILINRPKMSDPRTWTIGFKPVRSETIIFDSANNEESISRSAERCWKFYYISVNKLEATYPDKKEAIDRAKVLKKNEDGERTQTNGIHDKVLDADDETRNGQYQVVEYYHIENKIEKQRIHVADWSLVPDFGYEIGTLEDKAALMQWGIQNNIDTTGKNTIVIPEIVPTLMVDIWIPELNVMLDSGKDERQLDGHLPFYAWSYLEILSTSVGLVDALWSSVKDFNKRQKKIGKTIETNIANKTIIHPDLVGGDGSKAREAIGDLSDSSKPIIADANVPIGAMDGMITTIKGSAMPTAEINDANFKLGIMNEISGLTSAMQGNSEKSGESSTLFNRKLIEGAAQQRYPLEGLIEHEHNKTKDWLKLVPIVYGGPANYNRSWPKKDSEEFVTMNEFIGINEAGEDVVRNDLSKIEDVDIVIAKSNDSELAQQAQREMDMAMLNSLKESESNGEIIAVFEGSLAMNANFRTDEQKIAMTGAVKRYQELVKLKTIANIEKLESSIAQSNAQEGQAVQADALLAQDTKVKQEQLAVASKNSELQMIQMDSAINQITAPAQPEQMLGNAPASNAQPQAQV